MHEAGEKYLEAFEVLCQYGLDKFRQRLESIDLKDGNARLDLDRFLSSLNNYNFSLGCNMVLGITAISQLEKDINKYAGLKAKAE